MLEVVYFIKLNDTIKKITIISILKNENHIHLKIIYFFKTTIILKRREKLKLQPAF